MASLYLHIPFCEHKCIYCDFYSVVPRKPAQRMEGETEMFLRALMREIDLRETDPYKTLEYETVFFGGGTPSLLAPSEVENIVRRLRSSFSIQRDAEITLETNPGTVDFNKLRQYREAGITRLSIGVQSFHDDDLKFLTRIHTSHQAEECVKESFRAGFIDVGIDLIFALPSQTASRWLATVERAVALQPTHISCYSLIVEPATPLHHLIESGQVQPISAAADAELYDLTMDTLTSAGYEQYEISNFALPGYRCRHNQNYWNHSNYLGFGPSAHSFWNGKRWWNVSDLATYRESLESGHMPIGGEELLTRNQILEEDLYLGLRSDGIDLGIFEQKHGQAVLERLSPAIQSLREEKMMTVEGGRIRLTPRGYALCDEICATLMR